MKKQESKKNSLFFNEDKTLEAIYLHAQRDGLSLNPEKRNNFMKNKWFKWGTALVLATSFIFMFTLLNNPEKDVVEEVVEKTVIAYVSVDINPSFEISVYDDNTVESIASLNDDALSIDVSDLIGMDVDLAIEAIVARATEAGFIDTTDSTDDYVLVTTVLKDEATIQQEEALQLKIQDRLQISETLNSVYVVELKSDMVTKFEADEKNVPVGLYVINGEILQEDGTYLSVKEIFANTEKVSELTHTYQMNINAISTDQLSINIQALIDKLSELGVDVSAYETSLANATDMSSLQTLHDLIISENQELLSGSQSNQNTDNQMGEPNSDNSNQAEQANPNPDMKQSNPNNDSSGPSEGSGSTNQGGKNN